LFLVLLGFGAISPKSEGSGDFPTSKTDTHSMEGLTADRCHFVKNGTVCLCL